MRQRRCDHCSKTVAIPLAPPGAVPWPWVGVFRHHCDPHEPCAETCLDLDFCSWRCVSEYAAARGLLDQAG
jgi:hypothetical protein